MPEEKKEFVEKKVYEKELKKEDEKTEVLEADMMNPKPEREVKLDANDVIMYKDLLLLKMAYRRAINEIISTTGAKIEEANLNFWENMNKKYKLDPKKQAVVNIRRNVLKEFPLPPQRPQLPPGMMMPQGQPVIKSKDKPKK